MRDTNCHAAKDGECDWKKCPQIRDKEPGRTGRHCPRDFSSEDVEEAPRLTSHEYDVLDIGISQRDNNDWALTTNRTTPLRTVRRLCERGLMCALPELVVLIDPETGFSYENERWRVGYDVTRAGRAAHRAHELKLQAVEIAK